MIQVSVLSCFIYYLWCIYWYVLAAKCYFHPLIPFLHLLQGLLSDCSTLILVVERLGVADLADEEFHVYVVKDYWLKGILISSLTFPLTSPPMNNFMLAGRHVRGDETWSAYMN